MLFVLVLGMASLAHAQDDRVVDTVVIGDRSLVESLEVVVRDLLSGDSFQLRWMIASGGLETSDILREREPDPRILARAWIDLSDADRWRLYIADERGERFLVRVIERGSSSDEVLRESLGRIVASTLHAIEAGLEIGTDRDAAERDVRAAMGTSEQTPVASLAEPEAPAAPSAPLELRLGAFFEAAMLHHSPAFESGPGVAFAIASGPSSHESVFVGSIAAQWLVPLSWSRGSYGARFDGVAVRANAAYELRTSPWMALEAGGGVGVDFLYFSTRSGPEALPLPPHLVVLPILRAAIGVVFRFDPITVPIRIGGDLDLSGTRYVAIDGATMIAILSPWIVRPFAHIEVDVTWH
jgi:hypothetical protein